MKQLLTIFALALAVSASAHAADPEGTFNLTVGDRNGTLTFLGNDSLGGEIMLDPAVSEMLGFYDGGYGVWERSGESEITFTYSTRDGLGFTLTCDAWPDYAVGEAFRAAEACWLSDGQKSMITSGSGVRVD
jgi:hypothetical protein